MTTRIQDRPFVKILTIVERDFVMVDRCAFGGHPITSGTGYILTDLSSVEFNRPYYPAGPICAKNQGAALNAGTPDFTRAMDISAHADDRSSASADESYPSPRTDASREVRAMEYMILRTRKLPELGFDKMRYVPISAAYGDYRAHRHELSPRHLDRIAGIMEKVETQYPEMSYPRLMGTYAIAHWIRRCEASGKMTADDHDFLRPIKKSLQDEHQASQGKLDHFSKLISDLKIVENPPVFRQNIFGL